ncbi:MAG: hypothetical protein HQM09_01050 [Candidatus Riflebacteria bacterium]|nr:hypothetical protein [Candidatus Riflebacteria bacterium]
MTNNNNVPIPISVILRKVDEASDPIARFIQLGNLFEVTLRYLATLTLGTLFHARESQDIDIPSRLLSGLSRPSLGHWCQLLHAIPKRIADTRSLAIPELVSLIDQVEQPEPLTMCAREIQYVLGRRRESIPKRFSLAGFFDLLVAFRNKTKAHGAIQTDLAAELNPTLEAAMRTILNELRFLRQYPVRVVPDSAPDVPVPAAKPSAEGASAGKLYVFAPGGNSLFQLFPAAIWHNGDFWFLNGWYGPGNVEYLSYSTGQIIQTECAQIGVLFEESNSAASSSFDPTIALEIIRKDVWELPVDLAVMAQDRQRLCGPIGELELLGDPKPRIRKVLEDIEKPSSLERMGSVIVSKRPWCASRLLLEVIIYDFDDEKSMNRDTIEQGLEQTLLQITELGPQTIAISPLGTEYHAIDCNDFVDLLIKLWEKHHKGLTSVARLIFTPREFDQVKPLHEALTRRLGRPVNIRS